MTDLQAQYRDFTGQFVAIKIGMLVVIAIARADVAMIGTQATTVCKKNLDYSKAFKILENEENVSYCFDSQQVKLITPEWLSVCNPLEFDGHYRHPFENLSLTHFTLH